LLFTPAIQLETLFILNGSGCIVSTREQNPSPGPRFSLIRGRTACAWAVHEEVPRDVARQIDLLAGREPPLRDFQDAPQHERTYLSLLGGTVESGPAFTFSELRPADPDIVPVEHVDQLTRHFRGWSAEELPICAPIVAIFDGADAVSVCFCARRSVAAAEAGLETADRFRGRGFGPRVTAAWASSVHASGLLPVYSTSWKNNASLAVARKLGLEARAVDWSVLPSAG